MSDHVTRQLAEACRTIAQVGDTEIERINHRSQAAQAMMRMRDEARAALAAYDAATKEKPEPPTIFRCEEGEHKGKWFRRTGEYGTTDARGLGSTAWPRGTWVYNHETHHTHQSSKLECGDWMERLELLPPVEVGQQWRWGSVTICIECRDKLAVNESWFGKDAATGSIVSRSASELYRNWTLIRTCPACGAECDEPEKCKCKQTPPRPADQFYDGEWWRADTLCIPPLGSIYLQDDQLLRNYGVFKHFTSWTFVRKYPDTLTADELVALGLKGARATLRDGNKVVLGPMDSTSRCHFGFGIHGYWEISLNRTTDAALCPSDILSLTIPTPRGDVTYRCDGGVCTRVREPKVEVGDVVECTVTGVHPGVCGPHISLGPVTIGHEQFKSNFRVVRRRGE